VEEEEKEEKEAGLSYLMCQPVLEKLLPQNGADT